MTINKDIIELLRKCLEYEHPLDLLREKFGIELKSGWQLACLDRLADEIEAAYIKLPVDAYGVPIRPGDLLVDTTSDYELYATKMFLGLNGWAINARRPDELRHVKPDTVEDIIMEAMQHAFSAPYKGGTLDMGDKVAEYADRIRKAVEDE